MKIFWSVHYEDCDPVMYLHNLMEFIDSNRGLVLAILPHKIGPIIEDFTNPEHTNRFGEPNRFVFATDEWGFPEKTEIDRFEAFLKLHYRNLLGDSEHYLLGRCTQDCVARMGRALIYGEGQSYWEYDYDNFKLGEGHPKYGAPIAPYHKVKFIKELCFPRKYDFVRIFDKRGRLRKKKFVSLDSVIGK
jgi:hypothetical protein